jgi:hypothetical protein
MKMRRKLSGLDVGHKFIVKSKTFRSFPSLGDALPRYAVHRIVEASQSLVKSAGADGETLEFPLDVYGAVSDWRVSERIATTAPLPDADDAAIIAYATPILDGDPKDHEIAVYVTSVDDGRARGHIIQFPERNGSPYPTEFLVIDEPFEDATTEIGNALFLDRPITLDATGAQWRSGDLLTARAFRCDVIDGVHVTTLSGHVTVGNFASKEDVGLFWPSISDHDRRWMIDYQSLPVYFHEEGRATAAVDPDEALVLVTRSGSRLDHQLVASTGALLYVWEDAAPYFEGIDDEGLWLATNLKGWGHRSYEGEWDAGIDFDAEPASLEVLERFGFDEATLTAELREMVDEGEEATASEYIAMASAAVSAKASQPAAA